MKTNPELLSAPLFFEPGQETPNITTQATIRNANGRIVCFFVADETGMAARNDAARFIVETLNAALANTTPPPFKLPLRVGSGTLGGYDVRDGDGFLVCSAPSLRIADDIVRVLETPPREPSLSESHGISLVEQFRSMYGRGNNTQAGLISRIDDLCRRLNTLETDVRSLLDSHRSGDERTRVNYELALKKQIAAVEQRLNELENRPPPDPPPEPGTKEYESWLRTPTPGTAPHEMEGTE